MIVIHEVMNDQCPSADNWTQYKMATFTSSIDPEADTQYKMAAFTPLSDTGVRQLFYVPST